MLKLFLCGIVFLGLNLAVVSIAQEAELGFQEVLTTAEAGDAEAQFEVGLCYQRGKGVEKDGDVAIEWYKKSAEQGYKEAYLQLGRIHARDRPARTNQLYAFECFQKALGVNPRSYFRLAYCYQYYEEVPRDSDKALELFLKAAELGDPAADYMLGDWYSSGTVVLLCRKTAKTYYDKAAAGDLPKYTYHVATVYLNGSRVLKNPIHAVELYERAVEKGYKPAIVRLAEIYRNGERGVSPNMKRAVELFTIAAEKNDADSQLVLCELSIKGEGVEKDLKVAKLWAEKAFDNGSNDVREIWDKHQLWKY
ncbi:tetratricopeptide repeat protein [Rubritalea sp.]|uniref:tetratricopeptide repeat protein n=1 Tax=Rubritalea sp. TaxID=2109375 RepID=UPI003EF2A242